ncbi:hypothetical protein [Enterococcus spodopteracolus]|uniref:hypothetical protein n=1 Tax=Enterococcus spodopteracolus TaxID=3034501 RepID=UPI00264A0282|nr:hypothetical protein [Enterococcus spodopteracolus]
MKKVIFSLVCLLGFLSIGLLGSKVQADAILPENTNSIMDVPINTPRLMSSVNTNNDFDSMLYLNQTKYAGWYYPTMQKQREQWYDQIVFEKSPRGVYIRVLQSKENNNRLYFNISNRGYVYLDRKENAREFSVTKLPPTNNLYYDTFRVTDLSTGQSLGIYNNYITIGSGTIPRNWIFV